MARFIFPNKKNSSVEEPKPVRKELSKKHMARVERENRQRRILLGGLIVVGIAIIGFIGYGLLDQFILRDLKAVAVVNGEKITSRNFVTRTQYVRSQLGNQYTQAYQYYLMFANDPTFSNQIIQNLEQLQSQLSAEYAPSLAETVLDRMMEEVLILQLAEKEGITVSEDEVTNALKDAFGYYPNGTLVPTLTATLFNTPTIDPAIFEIITATPTLLPATATATLEVTPTELPTMTATATLDPAIPTATAYPTETPMTEAGFATRVSDYLAPGAVYGFEEADFRFMYKIQLLQTRLSDKVTADLKPVQEQVWARHILVTDETTANDLYAQLLEGADFATLAQFNSLDTSNASTGGDLGWFGTGVMVTEFETAAFALKPGQISPPVKTDFGWHIIQCIDHAERNLTASEFNAYKQRVFTKWLDEQKAAGQFEKLDYWRVVVPLEPGVPALQ